MDLDWSKLLENSLYMLALLNPASKVMFLSTYEPALTRRQIVELSWKSSLAALIILIFLAAAGEVVLSRVFKVELYSLRITGGMILFMIGWMAVREGRFVQKKEHKLREDFTELSLVPLASLLASSASIFWYASSRPFGLGVATNGTDAGSLKQSA